MKRVRTARHLGITMVALLVFLAMGCVNTVGDCTLVVADAGDTELDDGGSDAAGGSAGNGGMGGAGGMGGMGGIGGMGGMGARLPETKIPKSKISRFPAMNEADWRDNSMLESPVD